MNIANTNNPEAYTIKKANFELLSELGIDPAKLQKLYTNLSESDYGPASHRAAIKHMTEAIAVEKIGKKEKLRLSEVLNKIFSECGVPDKNMYQVKRNLQQEPLDDILAPIADYLANETKLLEAQINAKHQQSKSDKPTKESGVWNEIKRFFKKVWQNISSVFQVPEKMDVEIKEFNPHNSADIVGKTGSKTVSIDVPHRESKQPNSVRRRRYTVTAEMNSTVTNPIEPKSQKDEDTRTVLRERDETPRVVKSILKRGPQSHQESAKKKTVSFGGRH